MRVAETPYETIRVNGRELTVTAELRSTKQDQHLLQVTSGQGDVLLARCLWPVNPEDIEAAHRVAAGVQHEIGALRDNERPELPRVHPELCGPAVLTYGARQQNVTVVVRDFIAGKPIDDLLRGIDAKVDQVRVIIRCLESVLRGLIALHERRVGHFDVRASNVIQPDRQGSPAVLIDLNASQVLRANREARATILYVDPRLAPEEWFGGLADEHSRIDLAQLADGDDLVWLDWYQFGLLIRELLGAASGLSSTNRRYLDEVANHLTSYPSCKRVTASEIHHLLERAKPEFLHPYGVPELVRNAPNDDVESFPDGQVLTKTGVIADIIRHPAFTRLFAVKQLTLLRYVFVGAEHTRAMHMMHCASLAADLMQHMFSDPRFRRTFESRDVRFAIVAALLHDINHFPFLHTFQESAGGVFTNRALFDEVMNSDFAHFAGRAHEPLGDLLRADGIEPERLWRVCYEDRSRQLPDSPVEQFVNSILDSGVDLDKLSYLRLDALFTGVPIGGGIDQARLMRSAIMTPDSYNMEFLAFDMKALPAVESVIHARLANFRSIYWHPRNRALMAMFLHVADSIAMQPSFRTEFLVMSEEEVVKRMNGLYEERTGRPSPMRSFVPLRGAGLYQELYEVPFAEDTKHGEVSRALNNLPVEQRSASQLLELRRAVGAELTRRYPRIGEVDESEVLIDIPSRPMDGRIRSLLSDGRGRAQTISQLSSTARAAEQDFQQLAKSIRVFVAPRLAEAVRAGTGDTEASWLGDLLFEQVSTLRHRQLLT